MYVAQGFSNEAIASFMGISKRGVEVHVSAISAHMNIGGSKIMNTRGAISSAWHTANPSKFCSGHIACDRKTRFFCDAGLDSHVFAGESSPG